MKSLPKSDTFRSPKIAIGFLFLIAFQSFYSCEDKIADPEPIIPTETYFPPLSTDVWETLDPAILEWNAEKIPSLYESMQSDNTKALIVLFRGRIVLEQYFDGFTQDSAWYWASAGKTIVSVLVGMSQQKNLLSIDNPTAQYLGNGWTSLTPEQENAITIRHQLSMSTGLSDAANFECTLPECLTFLSPPNQRWAYHNAPYLLLQDVLESVHGATLNQITFTELGQTIGMNGLWIKTATTQLFFSKARNMARFGLLISENGTWNGSEVYSESDYFSDMISTSQTMNESYGYLWWLNGKNSFMVPSVRQVFSGMMTPEAPQDMYAAMGANGQLISIVPSLDLVVVRMGESDEEGLVAFSVQKRLWTALAQVIPF